MWILLEMGLATIRHGGLSSNLIYFIDETSRELNEDKLVDFYRVCPWGKNLDVCAK